MTSSRRLRRAAAFALVLLLDRAASGQPSTPRRLQLSGAPPTFQESFNRKTLGVDESVTGSELRTIVGLQLGPPQGRFDMSAIRLALPMGRAAAAVCVKVSSADSRYTADNSYRPPTGGGTFGLDAPTRYRGELSSTYDAREMVVLAMMGASCSSPGTALFVPVLAPGAGTRSLLTVYVNVPRDRVQARLRDGSGRVLASVACRDVTARAVAYTSTCPLPLGATVVATLSLEIISRTGRPLLTYAIQLPERTRPSAD